MVVVADVDSLIQYMSQVLWLFVALSVIGMLVLRWTQPKVHRPIRVPLAIPIVFLLVCLSIVFIGAWAQPWNTRKHPVQKSAQTRQEPKLGKCKSTSI